MAVLQTLRHGNNPRRKGHPLCLQGSQLAGRMLDVTLLWARFLGDNDAKQRDVGLHPHIRCILVGEELHSIDNGAVECSGRFQALLKPFQQYAIRRVNFKNSFAALKFWERQSAGNKNHLKQSTPNFPFCLEF
uniref:Uncharacterized protein n=1 Tax=Anopheles melas TaxID=34690 RepID=A0A182TQN6_9DIPT